MIHRRQHRAVLTGGSAAPTFLMAVSYTGHDDAEIVAREIKKAGYGTVGLVGPTGMYYAFCSHLRDLLGESRLVDLTEEVDHLRATKSAEEIAFIRQCASMQDDIIDKLRGFIKPGLRISRSSIMLSIWATSRDPTRAFFLARRLRLAHRRCSNRGFIRDAASSLGTFSC